MRLMSNSVLAVYWDWLNRQRNPDSMPAFLETIFIRGAIIKVKAALPGHG